MRSMSGELPPGPAKTRVRTGASGPSVASVLASFNTWAFKREQPSSITLMKTRISDAMLVGSPVPFVLYWGKGPRHGIDRPDIVCLTFLASLARRIEAVYAPGAELRLIFTDTHAELNGHARCDYEAYFGEIERHARDAGFRATHLSAIVRSMHPTGSIREPALDRADVDRLVRAAERWYLGAGSPVAAAERYLRANLIEQVAVEKAFPDAIFATFSGSDLDFLFPPRMPRFYMYSLRKGCSVKPWFIGAGG
ncbi:MAG: hypothetical protein SFW09_11520 [Hyphomicrobiaceae bacterium]|nr:hypothetical protein [Hyphomicrobiaceae bacterium]